MRTPAGEEAASGAEVEKKAAIQEGVDGVVVLVVVEARLPSSCLPSSSLSG